LLLDADIQLRPGMAAALLDKAKGDKRPFVSIMARLRIGVLLGKLLMPAFVYFFKLLYPFRLANSDFPMSQRRRAAASCWKPGMPVRNRRFRLDQSRDHRRLHTGQAVKQAGYRTWVGQSHSVVSARQYDGAGPIWEMVARSAFTQLRYSVWLLALCTLLIASLFLGRWRVFFGVMATHGPCPGGFPWHDQQLLPTLRYYVRSSAWAPLLPVIATLFSP